MQARFFKEHLGEAEEYDQNFVKKNDEDLNMTLMFVSSG